MTDMIRVLIVDDIPETRDHLTRLLGFEKDVEVVGAAASGAEALELTAKLRPDIVLMDINMPELDGIATTELLTARVPTAAVVMMSVQGEADYLRRSMLAGAREFLVKPFSSDELTASIRQVHAREREKHGRLAAGTGDAQSAAAVREPGRVVAVFSPKGGVGRTTIAVNLAVAAAAEPDRNVVLVDGSFQFGDVGVLLNLNPKGNSISEAIAELDGSGEADALETYLVAHSTGVRVLLAPPSPEMAELVTPAAIRRILDSLRARHDLVLVDCAAAFSDSTLTILDAADVILTVLTLEITSIKNIRLFLEIAEQLGYPTGKIELLLNRSDSALGIRVTDVEHSIGKRVDHTIVSDGRSVVYALNRGVPFVASSREAQVSRDIIRLARALLGPSEARAGEARKAAPKKSLFAWR
jgi:pilus assembly protein CpaE